MKATYLDLSTGHLSRGTMHNLELLACPDHFDSSWPAMTIAAYPHGVFITVPADCTEEQSAALPADLRAVFDYAKHPDREANIQLLRFDSDGDQLDNLPFYEW